MIEKKQNIVELPWGKLYQLCETDEFDVSIETIEPEKKLPPYYYKKGCEILYVLEGEGQVQGKKAKKGDLFHVKPKQTYRLGNPSKKVFRFIAICIPPYNENDCVWIKEENL